MAEPWCSHYAELEDLKEGQVGESGIGDQGRVSVVLQRLSCRFQFYLKLSGRQLDI